MHEILLSHGYELVDDAWDAHGHRTYAHNGKADREHLVKLRRGYVRGWVRAPDQMRMFRHRTTADIIELSPAEQK